MTIALHDEEPNSLEDLLPLIELDDINLEQRLTVLACQESSPKGAPREHPLRG